MVYRSYPAFFAMANVVVESSPPLSKTMAFGVIRRSI